MLFKAPKARKILSYRERERERERESGGGVSVGVGVGEVDSARRERDRNNIYLSPFLGKCGQWRSTESHQSSNPT